MGDYEDYLNKLKKIDLNFDDEKMHLIINHKITHKKPNFLIGKPLAFAGSFAMLLIGFGLYFNVFYNIPNNRGLLSDYVFQSENLNNDSVMDYVFVD